MNTRVLDAAAAIASIGGATPSECRLRLERVALLSLALSLLATVVASTLLPTINVVIAVYGLAIAGPRLMSTQPRAFFLFGCACGMSIIADCLMLLGGLFWFFGGIWNLLALAHLLVLGTLKAAQLHSAAVLFDHLGGTLDDVMPTPSSGGGGAAAPTARVGAASAPRLARDLECGANRTPTSSGGGGRSSRKKPTRGAGLERREGGSSPSGGDAAQRLAVPVHASLSTSGGDSEFDDEDEEAALIAERLSISLAASSYQGDGTSALSQAEM